MKFGEMLRQTQPELLISRRYDAWMAKNSNPVYSAKALDFMLKQLSGTDRVRKGTYSASSLNSCVRKQQFGFIGMPQLPPTPKTAAIFQNGTMMHIRWQMAGLTEGWMEEAEVPIKANNMTLHGTMDGVAYDGSVVELKSINSNGFAGVSTFGPKDDHLAQGATYAAAEDADKVIFIYEDKNTQEYREFVVGRDALPITEVKERAERLWHLTENKELAEPLDKCMAGEGYQFHGCPYRDRCLKVKSWEHAEEMSWS